MASFGVTVLLRHDFVGTQALMQQPRCGLVAFDEAPSEPRGCRHAARRLRRVAVGGGQRQERWRIRPEHAVLLIQVEQLSRAIARDEQLAGLRDQHVAQVERGRRALAFCTGIDVERHELPVQARHDDDPTRSIVGEPPRVETPGTKPSRGESSELDPEHERRRAHGYERPTVVIEDDAAGFAASRECHRACCVSPQVYDLQ